MHPTNSHKICQITNQTKAISTAFTKLLIEGTATKETKQVLIWLT
jgi:hypothetical protein